MKRKNKYRKVRHYRELSVLEYRRLVWHCNRYARIWFVRHFMPMCDLEDTVVDAVDNAYERIACKREIRNFKAFMRISAYRATANALRKRKFRKNLVWIDAIPLTQPDRDETNEDDEIVEEGFFVSDGGAGAERVRHEAEVAVDSEREPWWLKLYRDALARQKGKARRVLRALRKDSRYPVAREISNIPERTFFRVLKKIRIDFAQCFQAYRAERNESEWQ